MSNYINDLIAEAARAEQVANLSDAQKEALATYTRASSALSTLCLVFGHADASEDALGALATIAQDTDTIRPDLPTFDRVKGDALAKCLTDLCKVPDMGVDKVAVDKAKARWIKAISALPKTPGASSGGSGGSRSPRPSAGFVLRFKDADGNVRDTHPADVPLSKQLNEARYAFGFKADAKTVTAALTTLITTEGAPEVEVPEVGKFWREALAG